jgi:glucose/arabinose dehydrogenase
VFGRPVDLLMLADGSMLVSDDSAGAIYRISYALN